jgi:hypothetical protein
MAAKEFARLTRETAFKTTFATSPVLNTDYIIPRLADGNSLTMRPVLDIWSIPFGGGVAIDVEEGSDTTVLKGQLKTKLYPAQATWLMNMVMARINAAKTLPYTTTELPGDLVSFTVDHGIQRLDGTVKRRRYVGCKMESLDLECSKGSPVVIATLGIVGSTPQGNADDSSIDPTSTVFPEPAITDYPTNPYTFRMTSGGLTVGTVRTQYDSLKISIKNKLDVRHDESRYANRIRYVGCESTLEAVLALKATPDDRSAYEAMTAQSCSVKWDNGVNSLLIDFQGRNKIHGVDDDLPIDKEYYYKLQLKNLFSTITGTNVSFTAA